MWQWSDTSSSTTPFVMQRKRLSIAVELVASPAVLFMDEPTSGLDGHAAAVVMRVARSVANLQRTIICTIHQVGQCQHPGGQGRVKEVGSLGRNLNGCSVPESGRQVPPLLRLLPCTTRRGPHCRLCDSSSCIPIVDPCSRQPRSSMLSTCWCCCRPAGG